ncbi:A disintegrin and metalloproteinase with thrombospondin motifs 15 [Strongylocentrotus purpuratus]|uniref:Peptidase M12B propeptide domain-containing protein n=1 Tax=Strongylocentrotus purpuratus TaxID=7668 RepID=A0A7M7T4G3_STRPU|nr:A disintegrin and metalloproteinase with thrombospondin motifs 15 [Strongylocentrotus purpuratus]
MLSRDMGVAYTILFLWLVLNVQGGYCLSEFHGILTEEELHSYTKKAQIKEYDIILPLVHDPSKVSKRSVDSANDNEAHKVTFTAFDEEHHVVLEQNGWLLRPDLEVEYLQPDGSIRKEPVQTRDCHFFATSISHTGSTGALSTCSGLRGILSVADELLHIEPLKEHHAKRMKRRSSEDAVKLHIIYKRSPSTDDATSCPVEPFTVTIDSNSASANGTVIPGNETVYTGPYLGAKFLEIFYVVDSLVYNEYLDDTESYAITILNIMSRRYADPSLDISMRISVVRLLISMTETLMATDTGGSPVTMTPTNNGDTSLDDFCVWQAAQSVNNDSNPDDWDLAMLFTG